MGSGLSDLPQDDQSIQSLSDDVIEILATMKVDKAVLVGLSFGGIVTAHLAATKSDVIIAAILIGPVLPNPSLEKVFQTRAQTVDKGMAWHGIACFEPGFIFLCLIAAKKRISEVRGRTPD